MSGVAGASSSGPAAELKCPGKGQFILRRKKERKKSSGSARDGEDDRDRLERGQHGRPIRRRQHRPASPSSTHGILPWDISSQRYSVPSEVHVISRLSITTQRTSPPQNRKINHAAARFDLLGNRKASQARAPSGQSRRFNLNLIPHLLDPSKPQASGLTLTLHGFTTYQIYQTILPVRVQTTRTGSPSCHTSSIPWSRQQYLSFPDIGCHPVPVNSCNHSGSRSKHPIPHLHKSAAAAVPDVTPSLTTALRCSPQTAINPLRTPLSSHPSTQ